MLARTLVAFVLALCAAPAMAEYGTIDEAPAATLLFPHFEVNPNRLLDSTHSYSAKQFLGIAPQARLI